MKTKSFTNKLLTGVFAMALLLSFSFPAGAKTIAAGTDNFSSAVVLPDGDKTPIMKCGGEKKEEKTTSTSVSEGAESSKAAKCGEGKCGEGKCGEGKTATTTTKETKTKEAEATSVSSEEKPKSTEGKCGEGKCGEGKCGTDR